MGLDAGAGGRVEKRDVAMVEEVEGLGDDIQVAGTEREHLEDAQVQVDVWGGRKRVAGVAERAGSERVDMFPITVDASNRICSVPTCDTKYWRKFEAGQQTHDQARVGVGGGILGIAQIGA